MTHVALGIDIGTGSTKAGLVSQDGRLRAVERAEHTVHSPDRHTSETAPNDWLTSARAAVVRLLAQHPGAEIVAVGLSGQMHGVVCADRAGRALRPAVLWSDRRSAAWLEAARDRFPDSLLSALANPLVAGMAGPTLAALQQVEPEVLARSAWYLQPKDWVRLQLTGEPATDPSDASATLLWDVSADTWSQPAADIFGVSQARLPPVRESGSAAGTITTTAAGALGIPSGVPVAIGAADTAAALLGAGVEPGASQLSVGTGGQLARLLTSPVVDPRRRTHLFRAAEPGRWYAMAAIQNAGIAIDWMRATLAISPTEADEALAGEPAGARGVVFLPYLTGERTPHVDAGLTARWVGLHPAATRGSLIRAGYEGVACALRDGLDALRSAGHSVDAALLAGGGTRHSRWRQLLADLLGIPLTPHDAADASVFGAAVLGWQAVDHRVDSSQHLQRGPTIEPRPIDPAVLAAYRRATTDLLTSLHSNGKGPRSRGARGT